MHWLAPLPVVLPLLGAAGLIAATPVCRRRFVDSAAILIALLVTIACCRLVWLSRAETLVYWFGDWQPRHGIALGICFAIDPIGAGLAAFCGFLVTAALLYAWDYFEAVRTYFHALMLIFLAAMAGFCLTGDLFNLFVFFELMSVVAYALTGYKVEETQALVGAMNFAVTNSVGAFCELIGVGLLYGRTGALNMAQVGVALAAQPLHPLVIVALTLIFAGFFVKAALVPFHFWLADAHAVAPTPVCVLFSGVMIELGLYGSFRVYWTVFHPSLAFAEPRLRMVLWTLGATTAVVGAIMCFAQRHLKRLLAFSSISHVGMMLIGAAAFSAKGVTGAALYILGHGCVKGSLFMCVGIVLHRLGSVDEVQIFARGRKLLPLGIVFAITALGLAGFPPYGTYLGKQVMEDANAVVGQHWPTWLFAGVSALTAGAILRAAAGLVFGWGSPNLAGGPAAAGKELFETRKAHGKTPTIMITATLLLTIAPLVSFLFGGVIATHIQAAAERFVDQSGYASQVLHGMAVFQPAPERIHATARGVCLGCVAAIAAVAVACGALWAPRLPLFWRKTLQAGERLLLGPLRKIHTGHIGDMIVWLVIGVVSIGVGLLFAAAIV